MAAKKKSREARLRLTRKVMTFELEKTLPKKLAAQVARARTTRRKGRARKK